MVDTPGPTLSRKLLGFEILAVACLFTLEPLVTAVAMTVVQPSAPPPIWYDTLWLVARAIAITMPVLYIMARSGHSWAHFGIVRPRLTDVGLGLLVCVAFFVWLYLFWAVVYFLVGPGPGEETEALMRRAFSSPATQGDLVLIVLGAVATGFFEELVARAYLIPRLTEWFRSPVAAVFLAGLLFASFHIYQGPWTTVVIFGMALLYGFAFVLMRRVWPLMLGHALMNILALSG